MRPERRLINAIHRHLPRSLHRQGMTSASLTTNGTPDYYYDSARSDLWIEYKALDAKPRSGIVVGAFTPLQLAWMTRRWEHGKNVVGIVGLPDRTAVIQHTPREWREGVPAHQALPLKEVSEWICEFCGS